MPAGLLPPGARGAVAALTLLALGVSGGAAAAASSSAAGSAAAGPYSLGATAQCLEARGASVARVRPLDAHLRRLRDLAQRTSREARVGKQSVGLAFARSEAGAEILTELLTVPNNPYRLDRRRNVVLMYKPAARAALAGAVACLRS